MWSAASASPRAGMPAAPSGLGDVQVPEASMTAVAMISCSVAVLDVADDERGSPRSVLSRRLRPRRVMAVTVAPSRRWGSMARVRGERFDVALDQFGAGRVVGRGRLLPAGSRRRAAASGSMSRPHGEKSRTWPHSRIEAPTRSPASRTVNGMPRRARWAAAVRPTGPAPITTVWLAVVVEHRSSWNIDHRRS